MVAPRVSPKPQAPAIPADAIVRSWVDGAPRSAQPYLRLMRLDRPIGTWLLFLPCVFGLALGAAFQSRGLGTAHDFALVVLFAVGAVVMRGAGCTYNDIIDKDIDASVARTRDRPIPSGAVSVKRAWLFLAAQCATGFAILLTLDLFSILLGAASLILIAIYPFMKRVTWWPQAWLGLTFNWGALLGFSAIAGRLAVPAFLLYAGCFFWTLGYDTIYAHQDKDDDALIGVRSTARLFGDRSRTWIVAFYVLTIALAAAAILSSASHPVLGVALLTPAAAHLVWQAGALDIDAPANCLRIFRSNRDAGLLIAAALIASSQLIP
jgi:4-hydroxybenzoate polyprenyltransferase